LTRRIAVTLALPATLGLLGGRCDGPTQPDYTPYVVEPVRYACGNWNPAPPSKNRALLDVHFGRRTGDDPLDRPREDSLDLVRQLGGEVVFAFNLPMARVILDVDRVPDLGANFVDGVSDPSEAGAGVVFRIGTPLSAGDLAYLESLGARDIRETRLFVSAWVPDRAIRELVAQPGVSYLEVNGIACTRGSGDRPVWDHPSRREPRTSP
jgi:hypothetical protein